MTESALTSKMVGVLRARGAWAVKIVGGPVQRSGLPDILVCYRGRFVGIEVKLPGKERNVTQIQAATLKAIHRAKGLSYVFTTVAEVEALLDRIDRASR